MRRAISSASPGPLLRKQGNAAELGQSELGKITGKIFREPFFDSVGRDSPSNEMMAIQVNQFLCGRRRPTPRPTIVCSVTRRIPKPFTAALARSLKAG